MANQYKNNCEIVTADDNLPGKVMLYEKPGKECFTNKHWHKNLEIDYIIKGRMWTSLAGEDRDVYDNDYILINPETVHQTCGKEPEEPVKYLVVLFSYSYIKTYFPNVEKYYFDLRLSDQVRMRIRDLLKAIAFEAENPSDFSKLKISGAMIQILVLLFTKCKAKKPLDPDAEDASGESEHIGRAIEYIKENYRERLSLEDISAHVGLTPTYFSRYFKNTTRKTFKNYLNLVRLEAALLEIRDYGENETQAALKSGFPSVKSFIAVFKSVYGCAPSEYVKLYHEEPPIFEIKKL